TRLQPVQFILHGTCNLKQQISADKDFLRGIDDPRPSLFILLIAEASAHTRLMLDVHLILFLSQNLHPSRRKTHAILEWTSFFRYTYVHNEPPRKGFRSLGDFGSLRLLFHIQHFPNGR